jgi:hypothetical protein
MCVGEEDDQDYFAVINAPTPVAKPAQLGVENGESIYDE